MGRPTDPTTETYKVFFKRSKDSTRKQNAYRLRTYCEWLKIPSPQLIEDYQTARQKNDLDNWERKQINRVMEFYNYLIEEYKQKNKEPNFY